MVACTQSVIPIHFVFYGMFSASESSSSVLPPAPQQALLFGIGVRFSFSCKTRPNPFKLLCPEMPPKGDPASEPWQMCSLPLLLALFVAVLLLSPSPTKGDSGAILFGLSCTLVHLSIVSLS